MLDKLARTLRYRQRLTQTCLDLICIPLAFSAAVLLQSRGFPNIAPLTSYAWYVVALLPVGWVISVFQSARAPRAQTFGRADILNATIFSLLTGGAGLIVHALPLPFSKVTLPTIVVFALILAVLRVGGLMALRDLTNPRFKPVDTTRFLGRDTLGGDCPAASNTYRDSCILVTGAGGSIGSELCRQLLSFKPKRLVLLDHSELALYTVHRELQALDERTDILPALGSIGSTEFVKQVITDNTIDVVFHAAAYKHLPMVENNVLEGLRNNVIGTRIVAEAAKHKGVKRFILVSSDKAVRPTSVMGSSKRLAELTVQDLATRSAETRFSIVRFGNVLGSSGSVLPLFEAQIRHGGPLTVTHPDVTRYFMTLAEAVHLVLMAGSLSRGGDVFVLDMGAPVSILNVAKNMIEGAGYRVKDAQHPKGDIEIRFTGLRPGEKMHEELLIGSDMLTTSHPKILRAQESYLSEIEMAAALQELRRAIETRDEAMAMDTLEKYVEGALTSDTHHIAS